MVVVEASAVSRVGSQRASIVRIKPFPLQSFETVESHATLQLPSSSHPTYHAPNPTPPRIVTFVRPSTQPFTPISEKLKATDEDVLNLLSLCIVYPVEDFPSPVWESAA